MFWLKIYVQGFLWQKSGLVRITVITVVELIWCEKWTQTRHVDSCWLIPAIGVIRGGNEIPIAEEFKLDQQVYVVCMQQLLVLPVALFTRLISGADTQSRNTHRGGLLRNTNLDDSPYVCLAYNVAHRTCKQCISNTTMHWLSPIACVSLRAKVIKESPGTKTHIPVAATTAPHQRPFWEKLCVCWVAVIAVEFPIGEKVIAVASVSILKCYTDEGHFMSIPF